MPAEMLRSLPTSIPPLDYTVIQYHLALGPLQCSVSLVGKANVSFGETLSGIELDSTDLGNKLKIVLHRNNHNVLLLLYKNIGLLPPRPDPG